MEIKFQTDAAGIRQAAEWPAFVSGKATNAQQLQSIYYDTEAGDLRQQGIELRVRKQGRLRPVLTVKFPKASGNSAFARGEVEVTLRQPTLDIGMLDIESAQAVSSIVGDKPLQIWFETRVRRHVSLVSTGASEIELALDEGSIVAGDANRQLFEVEFELKSGRPADLYRLAMQAAGDLALSLDFCSKGSRGFRLREGKQPSLIKSKPPVIAGVKTRGELTAAVLSSCLSHFTANWALFRESNQPEAVHQLRVSLRRMRSALHMLGRKMPQQEFELLREEAKQIATALGPAREIDVFVGGAETGPLAAPDCPQGREAVLKALNERREEAYRLARDAINGRNATLFVLRVHAFVDTFIAEAAQVPVPVPRGPSQRKLARKILRKLEARVMKRGEGLPEINAEARHKLRIGLKDLRYGADFVGGFFGKREKTENYLACVSELQEILGAQNDVAAAKALVARIAGDVGPECQAILGFILGWYAHNAGAKDERIMQAWKNFRKAEVFWE